MASDTQLYARLVRKGYPLTVADELDAIIAVLRDQIENSGRIEAALEFQDELPDDPIHLERQVKWITVARKAAKLQAIALLMAYGVHEQGSLEAVDDLKTVLNDER